MTSKRKYPPDLDDLESDELQQYMNLTLDPEEEWQEEHRELSAYYESQSEHDTTETITQPAVKSPVSGTLPSGSWFYDDWGYYAYVLIDGTKTFLNQAEGLLEQYGIYCPIAGKSYRPASNGKSYNWYIRVFIHMGGEEVGKPPKDLIESILSPVWRSNIIDRSPKPDMALQNIHSEVLLKSKEEDFQRLGEMYKRLTGRLRQEKTLRKKQHRELEARILALPKELDRTKTEQTKPEIADFTSSIVEELQKTVEAQRKDLADLEKEWKESEESNDQLRNEKQDLQNDRDMIQAELKQAKGKLAEYELNYPPAPGVPQPQEGYQPEEDLKRLLGVLLPNISFMYGSLGFLAHEVRDPTIALKVLRSLTTNPESIRSKRVESTEDWLEIHFSTGDSDGGRIYYAKSHITGQYYVLVSHKKLQKFAIHLLSKKKVN